MRPRARLNASQSISWVIFLPFSIFCALELGETSLPYSKMISNLTVKVLFIFVPS